MVIAASSGIGRATVDILRGSGHSIFTTARSADKITPDLILDATDFDAVAPGLTETPMTATLLASEASRKVSESMHALGRLGKPGDVARAIAFLLDPENSWITGQVLGSMAACRASAQG